LQKLPILYRRYLYIDRVCVENIVFETLAETLNP